MANLSAVSVLAVSAALLAGCVTPRQQAAETDAMLTQAGFRVLPSGAVTGALLQSLPANAVAMSQVGGQETWYYVDKLACGCVYSGSPANLDAFRALQVEQLRKSEEVFRQINGFSSAHGSMG